MTLKTFSLFILLTVNAFAEAPNFLALPEGPIGDLINIQAPNKKELLKYLKDHWEPWPRTLSITLMPDNKEKFSCSETYYSEKDIPEHSVYCGEHFGRKYWLIQYSDEKGKQ